METRRKIVTIVFADVVGSTALGERVDPETLRWAMERWFDRMRDVVERHGGTIENYIGDAVMAVFGIPVAHEDDALRAVRAAEEMRDEVTSLREELRRERAVDFSVRIGVNTGPAVTGGAATGGSFTAGDTVNTAARLEQAARPGDVLLGQDTYSLVRHAVDAEPLPPLTAKGKSGPLEARRLVAVTRDARSSLLAPARQWSDASASGDAYWTPFIRPWPTVHASCSLCLAAQGSASRASSRRSWRRSTAQRRSHPAAACHTGTA